MATEPKPQFSEDEDLERARAFWKENGRSIIAGIAIGIAAIVGYNGWQTWQRSQGENASILFENLQAADITPDAASSLTDDLMNDYQSSPYASYAALLMARKSMEASPADTEAAATYLQWVLDNSGEETLNHVARLRLAQVKLAAGDAEGAISVVNAAGQSVVEGAFAARYQELKGDAEAAIGDNDSARSSWEKSLELLQPGDPETALLKLKLDNLGKLQAW